jgi:hypothetical protein
MHLLQEGCTINAGVTHIHACLFIERREQEEDMQVREYQDHIKELCEASEAQGEAFQQLYVQHEEALKVHSVR